MKATSKTLGFLLIPLFSFFLGWQFASDYQIQNQEKEEPVINLDDIDPEKIQDSMYLFKYLLKKDVDLFLAEEILGIIEEKYVNPEDIDPQEITYGLAKGIVYSLDDPFSSYLTPDESENFQDDLDGSLEGIGAELNMRDGQIIVISPLRDSPAKKAGLLPQDIILKVDDEDISGQSLYQVVKKIQGTPGTIVKLSIKRKNEDELIDLEIIRARIHLESVELEMKDKIAIIEVNQFGTNTSEEFEKYLSQAILDGAEGIVLDLRFNSGGYLITAKDIVSAFVADGKVAVTKSKPEVQKIISENNQAPNLYVTGNKKTDLPLVVLQNGGSASASEIVAGALKDHQRATIIGETSFGKGTVQEVIPLKHGGNLKLTIAKWFTPNGTDINEVGIEPDIEVENTIEDFENNLDPQMDKAIEVLKEKIENS